LHPRLRPKKFQAQAVKQKFSVKTLDGGEGERRSLVSARSDTTERKSSESEGVRLDRIEAMLLALLNKKLGPGPSLNSFHSSKIKGSDQKPNRGYNKTENNSVGPNYIKYSTDLASGFNYNKCLTIGLSTKNTTQNYTKWVLDSGATDHMIGNQTLLKNYRTIMSGQYFTVVNNERIKLKGWGMISIFPKKFLQDVFYVENCSVNLLSISKLSKELNCEIIFKEKIMIFQDLVTKEKIGEG
jgi:hypothetical protein